MKPEMRSSVARARAVLTGTALDEAKRNPLAAAFLGWLLREASLLDLLDDAASQASGAKGAERSSRNVAILGFACGVDSLSERYIAPFLGQLEWSIGRPNFLNGGEPCGIVADVINLAGVVAGEKVVAENAVRNRFDQWIAHVWKDADALLQSSGWRRDLHDVLGRRLSLDANQFAMRNSGKVAAALNTRGWVELKEASAKSILESAMIDATNVTDGFEAGLRLAAIDWAMTRIEGAMTLVLSGGGLRATLFQLGVTAYLAHANELHRVRGLVSVSGGSILAAHFAVNWVDAVESLEKFSMVAAKLVRFAKSDIRHQVLIPWLWSWLNPVAWFSEDSSLSGRLRAAYARHFKTACLGDLDRPDLPQVAFVATDALRRERIAFTARVVARFPVSPESIELGTQTHIAATSTGVPLELAIATSSCFPPLFPRMNLTHKELGLHFDEFKDRLSLNDGGVIGNLGISVLLSLNNVWSSISGDVIVVDAERPQGNRPGDRLTTDLGAQGAALSRSEIELAKQRLGSNVHFVRLSSRQTEPPGLPFSTQTPLAVFRTDLDAPSWQECHSLMLHGFAAAAISLAPPNEHSENSKAGRDIIANILRNAGGPLTLPIPTVADLKKSGVRPLAKVLLHIAAVIGCILGAFVAILAVLLHS